jgi:prefoldin subunit 5
MALGALEREQELSASLASSLAALTQEIAALRAGMREMQEQVAAVTARQRRWWQRK